MEKGRESKPHIGIFGRRNTGKSSIINALTGQEIAIVSDVAGTTTDPVKKSLEIHGIGPVIIIDTAGIDDTGELGNKRIQKSEAMTKQVDLAILVITNNLLENSEVELINNFKNLDLPFIVVHNKCDIQKVAGTIKSEIEEITNAPLVEFSALHPENYLNTFIQRIKDAVPPSLLRKPHLLGDLVKYGDIVLLITPIDIEAPEGRLILPQIQTIRDILDNDCTAIVVKEREVDSFLKKTGIQPALVVTDSQIFLKADASIPRNIPLTSFSILLARQKGDFHAYLRGTPKISDLKNGDRVLLLESCSHHVSCDDIGRVKIPRWITNFTGKKLEYDTVAGLDELPRPMEDYALVIQCGGCMITRRQLINRLQGAKQRNIPVTNYGMAIAYVQGIFNRAVEPFIGESKDQDQLI